MTVLKNLSLTLVLVISGCWFCQAVSAQERTTNLFEYMQAKSAQPEPQLFKRIELNEQLRAAAVQDELSMDLPDGRSLTLKVIGTQNLPGGDKIVRASDAAGNSLVITIGQQAAFGSLYGKGMRYHIGYKPGQGMYIVDQTSKQIPAMDLGDDALIPPNAQRLQQLLPDLQLSTTVSGETVIRILILYSPEFAAGFGSAQTKINQTIAFTNESFSRSNIGIKLRLARATQLNFNNASSNSALLSQVTDGTGAFSGVPQLRDSVGADLVAVLRYLPVNFGSGLAWLNGDDPDFAFSVTQFSPVGFDSVFAHEIGHNLGSGHERSSANPGASSPCGFNFTGFSCGHGISAAGWGTIMSRLNSAVVNHVYSNPNLNCLGSPCGIPQGQANAADNMTSFNISKSLVANFRDDPPSATPAIIPLLLDE